MMPPWKIGNMDRLGAAVLLAVTLVAASTAVKAVTVKDGDIFNGESFDDATGKGTIDVTYLLTSRTVSSTVQFNDCNVKGWHTVTPFDDPPDSLATSLYMKWVNPQVSTAVMSPGAIEVTSLPPNAYVHSVGGSISSFFFFGAFGTNENVTLRVQDATLNGYLFDTKPITTATGHHVTLHISGITFSGAQSFLAVGDALLLSDESFFLVEHCRTWGNINHVINIKAAVTISKHSAMVFRNITSTEPVVAKNFFYCNGALTVDETSVFSLIDIDAAEGFKASTFSLFNVKSIQGQGVIMLVRVAMQKSGLTSLQPVNNANFWVSAKGTRSSGDVMTTAQLLEEKFNVNDANTMNWDGTDASGDCVQAGLAVPGRATYVKNADGNCSATCSGDNVPPLCTAPYVNPCLVSNCELCYRISKDRCLACDPHATAVGEDRCECSMLPHCLVCSAADVCTQCEVNYQPDKEGKCKSCTIPHCTQCPTGVCSECSEGYKSSPDQKECFKCAMPHCEQCSSDNVCHICETDNKPANKGKDCYHCTLDKCLECKEDGTCRTCENGYKPSADGKQCYQSTIDNCHHFTSNDECGECADEYKLTTDKKHCYHCTMPHCTECSSDGVCAACDANYKLSPIDGKCYQCTIANCDHCTSDGVCGQCADEYKLTDENKVCYHCMMPHCTECSSDDVCAACDDKHKSSPVDGQCYECTIEHCNYCTEDGVCGQCADEYKLTNKNKDCFHCSMPHCTECSSDDVCASCDAPHKPSLDDGQCYECTIEHCNYCTSDGVCGECAEEYKLTTNKNCYHCIMPHCTECSADGMCMQCAEGYKPSADRKSCLQCTESHCAICGTNNDCQLCDGGHTLTKKGKCISCDLPGCQRCDLGGICAMCDGEQETVTADGTGCVSCSIGNCTYCSDDGKCAMCACGMVPTNDGSSCVACDVANCVHCDLPGDGHTCAECASGYALSDDGDVCERVSMPPWAVFLIVAGVTACIVAAGYASMFLYLRHQAKEGERAADAVERRGNRQDNYYHHRTELFILDIGDIENAASGVRDVHKEICLKPDNDDDTLKKQFP